MASSKASKIAGRIFKLLFIIIVLAINGTLFWRMCAMRTPSSVKTLLTDDALCEAYRKNDGKLDMFKQSMSSDEKFTTADRNYGYFAIVDVVFIPEAEQLQIVLRYNDSTLKAVAEDYGLDEVPSVDAELFDVSIIKTVDLTPDNKKDNEIGEGISKERIFPSKSVAERSGIHNYRRFIFNGVSAADAEGIFVDIYYIDDVDYNELSYGTLCVYSCEKEDLPVEMSDASKKAIEEYISEQ